MFENSHPLHNFIFLTCSTANITNLIMVILKAKII